jgi:hypothetical protein
MQLYCKLKNQLELDRDALKTELARLNQNVKIIGEAAALRDKMNLLQESYKALEKIVEKLCRRT